MSITIKVNPYKASSISKAIKELQDFKKVLTQFPKPYTEALAQRFDEILNEQCPAEAKGMWVYKIVDTDRGAVGIFEFNGNVEFIEFGTGIVGKEKHSGINEEWLPNLPPPYTGYESGHYIDPVTHMWWYIDNGKRVGTKGQEADPFMYRSVNQLLEEAVDIAKKVLRGDYGTGQE